METSKSNFEATISRALESTVKCLRCVQDISKSVPTYYVQCIADKVQDQKKALADPTDPDAAKKIYDETPQKFYVVIAGPKFEPKVLDEQELIELRNDKQQKLKLLFK